MDYEKLKDYFNLKDKFHQMYGIKVTKIKSGYAEAEMTIEDRSFNALGLLHGGAFYTLADCVAAVALLSYGVTCVTLNSSVNFIKSVTGRRVKAIANEVSRSRKIGIYRVAIIDEHENLLAECTFTMYIVGNKIENELINDFTAKSAR